MAERTAGYIVLTFQFTREGKDWVGTCLELGTSTFAPTLKRVQKELEELVVDHLTCLEAVGERERFFKEWGIEFHRGRPTGPQAIPAGHDVLPGTFGPFFQPRIVEVGEEDREAHLMGI